MSLKISFAFYRLLGSHVHHQEHLTHQQPGQHRGVAPGLCLQHPHVLLQQDRPQPPQQRAHDQYWGSTWVIVFSPLEITPVLCMEGYWQQHFLWPLPLTAPDGPPMEVILTPMTSQSIRVTWRVKSLLCLLFYSAYFTVRVQIIVKYPVNTPLSVHLNINAKNDLSFLLKTDLSCMSSPAIL